MKKKVLAAILVGMMTVSLAACGSSSDGAAASTGSATKAAEDVTGTMKGETITVGTSGLFGPFSYYDTDGTTLIGYDIDLLTDIQGILGFEIDGGIQAMDYSALTTSITEGKLDVGAAALCATDERKKVMDFSQTYCDSGQMVMVNKDNDEGITGVDDLAGKTVAVEKGTASHIYAQKNLTDATIEVHDTITTAYESLEQKKVDAVIQDGPGCAFYIKTTDQTALETVGDEFNQGQAPYAIAYNKDFKYQDEFNAALKMLKEDGTLDELYTKWCE
ncbi:MAG: transporter substrate-binding domain-containing protein [Hespellia sp.]|nr:transporter substrate-binding domain-containing protein [Hespellia sp.]